MNRWQSTLFAFAAVVMGCIPGWSQPAGGDAHSLYSAFQDPPRQYSVRPFWFWNGKLEEKEVNRQIEEMVSQGVYGVFVHNRTGLQTPYLSEDYFRVVGSALKRSKELGFHLGFCDDYEWPSGEARDVWLKGLPSRVIAANPEFRMRSLGYQERIVEGPQRVEIAGIQDFQFAVAGRMTGPDSIDDATLTDISSHFTDGKLTWDVPQGRWTVTAYYLYAAQGVDGGLVDLMNAKAVRTFLDLTYEQYYKRFGEYFGSVIDASYADHEGSYGSRIAWTPVLFDTFRASKGYDLRKYLPLLIHEGGRRTPKVRCDYLDTVSELYSTNFFGQVAEWCRARGVTISGHVWEEALQTEVAFDGDLQRDMRHWGAPGVDSLDDYGRRPRDFKVTASVAHFRNSRFFCENQGVQGMDSYLDMQKMRLATNMIGAWGVNQFVPHAFNYNRTRIEYPSDWFYHQPYWKFFKHYADYTRRISYMNDGGVHVADVLLYQPSESIWANSEPVFSAAKWNNAANPINDTYTKLMNGLSQVRWDYDVADSYYLREARIADRRLEIGSEKFRALVLPPLTTLRRETANKIAEFYEAGGTVVATGFLPRDSMEEGRNDPAVREAMVRVFGEAAPTSAIERGNAAGGRALFVKADVAAVVAFLDAHFQQDIKVTSEKKDGLFGLHRRKDGADLYWLVNDSDEAREFAVTLSARGVAEKWDAADGSRQPLYSHASTEGTELRLRFAPWEAYYVVVRPDASADGTVRVDSTNLETVHAAAVVNGVVRVSGEAPAGGAPLVAEVTDAAGAKYRGSLPRPALAPIEFASEWSFTPEKKSIRAPYAATRRDARNEGERAGWNKKGYAEDGAWSRTWLSRERLTVRQWSLIGPFPNQDYKGFHEVYPPERGFDPKAAYPGENGATLRWIDYDEKNTYFTKLAKPLHMPEARLWVTAYAHTFVYSPIARRVEVRTTADNNAKLWVNGKNLLDWLIVPMYYEMREDFALTRTAELQAGWNDLLLKVSRGPRGSFAFMVRLTDENGANLDDVIVSRERFDVAARPKPAPVREAAWYRIPVPVAAVAVKLPRAKGPRTVFCNGVRIAPAGDGTFPLGAPAAGKDNVLAVRLAAGEEFADEPEFLLGKGRAALGSWTFNGLPYFSGSAAYEQEIEIPRQYAASRLMLDCGQVGAVAEVQVNGSPAGVRVWLPFRFDITKLVHPGKNKVRIVVTNTMENERAVENHADQLEQIKLNGLLGPVRVIPYFDATIECPVVPVATARN
jgi:hypothetical protein